VRRRIYEAVTFGAAGALALVFSPAACGSSSAGGVGPGGECSLATDCIPGLVCVEQQNGARLCSDDLTRVAGEAPPDGAPAARDAAMSDAPADAPPMGRDTGVPDTGRDTGGPPPPVDSGSD